MGFGAREGPFQADSPCRSRCQNFFFKNQLIPKMQKKFDLIYLFLKI